MSQPLKDTRSPDHCETKQAPRQSKSIKMIDLCNKEVPKHQEQLDLGLSLDFANVSGPIGTLLQKSNRRSQSAPGRLWHPLLSSTSDRDSKEMKLTGLNNRIEAWIGQQIKVQCRLKLHTSDTKELCHWGTENNNSKEASLHLRTSSSRSRLLCFRQVITHVRETIL